MEKVSLPGLPDKRAADYQLDGFDPPRFARVIYTPQESKPDRRTIECQAFEVDADGRFVSAPNGVPSRTAGTIHTISVSGVGDTHTLLPGWVRVPGNYAVEPEEGQKPLPEGTQVVETLAEDAEVGAMAWMDDTLYRWDRGMVESVMRGKAEELAGLLRNSASLGNLDL